MTYTRPSDATLDSLSRLLEWKSCDNGYLHVTDMTEDHIENAMALIKGVGRWNGVPWQLWVDLFQFELDRRSKIRRQLTETESYVDRLRDELRTAEIKLCNLRAKSYV